MGRAALQRKVRLSQCGKIDYLSQSRFNQPCCRDCSDCVWCGAASFSSGYRDANLSWGIFFAAALVLVGGYEVGKYAEMRREQRKVGS